jgi:hypothetical protein
MDCSKEKCDVIDECRCYADETFGDPTKNQICGKKLRDTIVPCRAGCCYGGCPGQCAGVAPREPFGTGKMYTVRTLIKVSLLLFILSVVSLIYLKTIRVKKV